MSNANPTTAASFRWNYELHSRMDGPHATLLGRISAGGGEAHTVQLDTGSCGIVISRNFVGPEYQNASGPSVPVHYIPSNVTHQGTLITMPVSLLGPDGTPRGATATVPVVVVADEPGNPFIGGMMGIGWQGPLDRNPLLHVVLDDGAGGSRPLSPGYVITEDYVEVGLTDENQAGFGYADLQPDPHGTGAWMGPTASVTLSGPGAPPLTLQRPMLMDTGVPLMMLWGDGPTLPAGWTSIVYGKVVVSDDVEITVTLPASGAPLLSYTFGNGTAAPEMPEQVLYMGAGIGLNTGIHVLTVYDYLLDIAGQRIGYRRRLQQ
jgi:hypothetical protein